MRTKYSVLNVFVGVMSQVLIALIGLVSRKVFIDQLGYDIQGVNATLTSIITMLSLTELGIGTAIVCNLYKPLAEDDRPAIIALMQLYSKVYKIIAAVVAGIGLCVIPFLPMIFALNDTNSDVVSQWELILFYGLFLLDAVLSYLFAYKRSIIIADQRQFIITTVYTIMTLLMHTLQIVLLIVTKSFLAFLIVKVLCRFIENFIDAMISNRRYPYIRTKEKYKVPDEVLHSITGNIKALALHYIGNYAVSNTATLVITHYIGTESSGIYSNYLLIINTLVTVFTQVSAGITASFGNLLATGDSEQTYRAFRKASFVVYMMANFCAISLFCIMPTFFQIWLGDDFTPYGTITVLVLCVNFFITSFAESMGGLRSAAGKFRPDRYLHIFLAVGNILLSIILVQTPLGVTGVFLSIFICRCIKELTVLPHICYKHILKHPFSQYEKMLWMYLGVTAVAGAATYGLCYLCTGHIGNILVLLVLECVVCVVVPNAVVSLVFCRTDEFKYLISLVKQIFTRNHGQEVEQNG